MPLARTGRLAISFIKSGVTHSPPWSAAANGCRSCAILDAISSFMDCMTSPGSFFDDRVIVGISSSLGFGFGLAGCFLLDGFLSKNPFFRPFFMPSPKLFFMRFSSLAVLAARSALFCNASPIIKSAKLGSTSSTSRSSSGGGGGASTSITFGWSLVEGASITSFLRWLLPVGSASKLLSVAAISWCSAVLGGSVQCESMDCCAASFDRSLSCTVPEPNLRIYRAAQSSSKNRG
mmetsp:Transcript_19159/g.54740  ORF Transcript_19159/g.54740 Transcript_19159/m.54740 type:complete len:234 (-) Transcript_19159:551-1252(-)